MKYPPSNVELCEYMLEHNLTNRQVCEILRVAKRTVGLWKAGVNSHGDSLTIPFSAWYTLRTSVEGAPPIDRQD